MDNRCIKENILHFYLDLIRGKKNESRSTELFNILNVMNHARCGVLDAENFQNLDFKGISLHQKDFSGYDQKPSDFSGSYLYDENFFSINDSVIQHIEVSVQKDLMILSDSDERLSVWSLNNRIKNCEFHIEKLLTWKYIEKDERILCLSKDGVLHKYDMNGVLQNKYDLGGLLGFSDVTFAVFDDIAYLYIVYGQTLFKVNISKVIQDEIECSEYTISTDSPDMKINALLVTASRQLLAVADVCVYMISEHGDNRLSKSIPKELSFFLTFREGFAGASKDSVYIFDNESNLIKRLTSFSYKIVSLNAVRNQLAVCLENGDVYLYAPEKEALQLWKAHTLGVICICEYGMKCISSSVDNSLCFWETKEESSPIKTGTIQGYISSFVRTDDSDVFCVVASQFHSYVEVWDLTKLKRIGRLDTETNGVSSLKVIGSTAIISTYAGDIVFWNWKDQTVYKKNWGKAVIRFDAIAGGDLLCLLCGDGNVIIWDRSREKQYSVKIVSQRPTTIKFLSKDDFVVAGMDGILEIYNLQGVPLYQDYPLGYPNEIVELHYINGMMLGIQFMNVISLCAVISPKFIQPCSCYYSERYISSAAPYKKSNLFAVYNGTKKEIDIINIHGALIRRSLDCNDAAMSIAPASDKKTFVVGTQKSKINILRTDTDTVTTLFYRPDMSVSGCNFQNINCTNTVRELLRQQDAIL